MNRLFTLILFLLAWQTHSWADCTTSGDDCSTPRVVAICGAQSYSEDVSQGCTANITSWTGASTITTSDPDIFYQVAITQDPSATTSPTAIEVTISDHPAGTEVFFLGMSCGAAYTDHWVPGTDLCQKTRSFGIASAGTYYFAIVSPGTFDVRFGGITGTSTTTVNLLAVTGCDYGDFAFTDVSNANCSSLTPFKTSQPYYELCLNGTTIPTNNVLTYNLGVTNQLCIKVGFENLTGGENFVVADFNFGPALTATPTTRTCSGATTLSPHAILAAQNGGTGMWQVGAVSTTTSPPAYMPPGVVVDKSISWVFDDGVGRGDMSGCSYNCAVYEFCFEITSTNNLPADTKIVGVFYPDDYSVASRTAGSYSQTTVYGCTLGNSCVCGTTAGCFALGASRGRQKTPIFIDFEDPAHLPALPVELLSFTGKTTERGNLLEWVTASEENNSHFEVQHSLDGKHFEVVGEVQGHGNSAERIEYRHLHEGMDDGLHYYQLKQVDFDGAYEYSSIISIQNGQEAKGGYSVYPTFSQGALTIHHASQRINGLSYEIYNNLGQLVMNGKCQSDSHESLDVSQLPQGQYYIRLSQSGVSETLRFIKS